jgi:hypothetical protein
MILSAMVFSFIWQFPLYKTVNPNRPHATTRRRDENHKTLKNALWVKSKSFLPLPFVAFVASLRETSLFLSDLSLLIFIYPLLKKAAPPVNPGKAASDIYLSQNPSHQ